MFPRRAIRRNSALGSVILKNSTRKYGKERSDGPTAFVILRNAGVHVSGDSHNVSGDSRSDANKTTSYGENQHENEKMIAAIKT